MSVSLITENLDELFLDNREKKYKQLRKKNLLKCIEKNLETMVLFL